MIGVRQRSADVFVRYAIVEADRQGVTGPLGSVTHSRRTNHALKTDYFLPERLSCVGRASALVTGSWSALH